MESSEDVIAWVGETVFIIAQVGGYSFPTIKVYADGRELTNSGRIRIATIGDQVEIRIDDVRMEDAGVYTIEATNEFGTADADCWLIVVEPA